MKYPEVSILIPTYNRGKFSELLNYNINIQDYPNILEVIILDDTESDKETIKLNLDNKKINVRHIKLNKRMTIGKKRNELIKYAKGKYCCYFDDDDIYLYTAISSSIKLLQQNKKKFITGTSDMLFYFKQYDNLGSMRCINIHMLNEATLCFERKKIKVFNMKFNETNSGEGVNFLEGKEEYIIENDIKKIMVCLAHSDNTISKEKWYNENYNLTDIVDIEDHKKIINKINF